MPSTSPPAFLLFLSLPPFCLPLPTAALRLPINLSFPLTQHSPQLTAQKETAPFTPSALSHGHIFHISHFHHSCSDPSFTLYAKSLWGFVWMQELMWRPAVAKKKPTLRLEQQTASGFRCVEAWYLFCTMIMAIQSEGYTCFPIRSLKSRNDSIRKSCRKWTWEKSMCVSLCWQIEMSAVVCRFVLTTRSEVPVKVSIYVI